MTTQINDLLSYSRITSIPRQLEKVDLNQVLEGVKEDFELLVAEKKATINHTPLPVLESTPLQMTKLFGNLIGNSLKFSHPQRPPVISVSSRLMDKEEVIFHRLDHNCSYYDIQFIDNGIGFDQKFAQQIFTLFQRLNDRNKFPGSGIGLALCRKIAENAGGKILAEGREGEGAVFHCLLPVKAIIEEQDAFI
jgi:signal transduction histidine kinase